MVRLAFDLAAASQGGFKFDPAAQASQGASQLGPIHWVFGGLMRMNGEGELVPDLAESAEVVDANTITVTMREGLTLSDGSTPLDAATMKGILEANLARGQIPAYRPAFFSLQTVTLTDDTTLTLGIPDGTAFSWYDLFLHGQETVPVPAGTNFDAPVGAGPFMIKDYSVAQSLVLEKNPEYWDAENIKLAGIELTHVPPDNEQAAVGAFNGGQVDWTRLTIAQIPAVSNQDNVITEPDPNYLTQIIICKSDEPLDDVLVRQAMNHAVDREGISEALYGGAATPAWDLWPEGHRLHNDDTTDAYPYDPEKAMELLEEAGAEDITVDFIPHGTVLDMAQILQQQFADVGITLNVIQTANFAEDLLVTPKAPMGLVPRGGGGRGKLDNFQGPSVGNICKYSDPEIDQLITDLKAVSDSSEEGAEIWKEIEAIWSEDALAVPIVFVSVVYGVDNDRVGGYSLMQEQTVAVPDMWELFIKA